MFVLIHLLIDRWIDSKIDKGIRRKIGVHVYVPVCNYGYVAELLPLPDLGMAKAQTFTFYCISFYN